FFNVPFGECKSGLARPLHTNWQESLTNSPEDHPRALQKACTAAFAVAGFVQPENKVPKPPLRRIPRPNQSPASSQSAFTDLTAFLMPHHTAVAKQQPHNQAKQH